MVTYLEDCYNRAFQPIQISDNKNFSWDIFDDLSLVEFVHHDLSITNSLHGI